MSKIKKLKLLNNNKSSYIVSNYSRFAKTEYKMSNSCNLSTAQGKSCISHRAQQVKEIFIDFFAEISHPKSVNQTDDNGVKDDR